MKIDEGLKQLNMCFKMLRVFYDKVNEQVPDPDEPAEEVIFLIFHYEPLAIECTELFFSALEIENCIVKKKKKDIFNIFAQNIDGVC